jgi:starch-binding outer membrane protein, SusD/RagB family
MNRYFIILLSVFTLTSCRDVLQPKPIDILADQFVLNEPADVETVRLGAYTAFRAMSSPKIMAGDFTADYIQANGTFTDYQELGNKQLTAANGVVESLWGGIFNTIYVCNFLIEGLPKVPGVREADLKRVTAEARFLRGLANFIGASTYGGLPKITTTDIEANKVVSRTSKDEILASVLADFQAALTDLPNGRPADGPAIFAAYATKNTARAALARYYLYQKNWALAEQFASAVISTNNYELVDYQQVVEQDFTKESIFEVGYSLSDDPGTSAFGLNNILVGRREVIPSNQLVAQLTTRDAGERQLTIDFDSRNQRGSDNGWTVQKYGTADANNNNIVIFRLGEMYLIRAEARAQQARIAGANGALADLNVLRTRAGKNITVAAQKPVLVTSATQAEALTLIERERVYELAFEGHRWYDLVRTGRAQVVMSAFSPNWNNKFEIWPLPQSELQRNPSLGTQNPGY